MLLLEYIVVVYKVALVDVAFDALVSLGVFNRWSYAGSPIPYFIL